MEITQPDDNLEIIFTLKLNKSFVKNVQDYPTFAENLMIIKNDTQKECVGSVAISNPVFESPCSSKLGKLKDSKSPKRRGRKRKNTVDRPMMLKMVQQAKGPISVEQSVPLQDGLAVDLPQPLDLTTKTDSTTQEVEESKNIDESAQLENSGSLSINENLPLDLSAPPSKTEEEKSSHEDEHEASESNSSREPLVPTDDPNCTAPQSKSEGDDLTAAEILSMITGSAGEAETGEITAPKNSVKTTSKRKGPKPKIGPNGSPLAKKAAKVFSCGHCEYSASSRQNLKDHEIADHATSRPFACTLCEHRSKQKQNLKLHYLHKHKLTPLEAAEILKTKSKSSKNEDSSDIPLSQVTVEPCAQPVTASFTLEQDITPEKDQETNNREGAVSPTSSVDSKSSLTSIKEEEDSVVEVCDP